MANPTSDVEATWGCTRAALLLCMAMADLLYGEGTPPLQAVWRLLQETLTRSRRDSNLTPNRRTSWRGLMIRAALVQATAVKDVESLCDAMATNRHLITEVKAQACRLESRTPSDVDPSVLRECRGLIEDAWRRSKMSVEDRDLEVALHDIPAELLGWLELDTPSEPPSECGADAVATETSYSEVRDALFTVQKTMPQYFRVRRLRNPTTTKVRYAPGTVKKTKKTQGKGKTTKDDPRFAPLVCRETLEEVDLHCYETLPRRL